VFLKTNSTLAMCLWVSTALAQDAVDLPEPSVSLDVRGFTIGMSAENALALLQERYPQHRPTIKESAHPDTAQKYLRVIWGIGDGETYRLYFTGHYSGSRLHALERDVQYPEGDRPSAKQARQDIIAKYGMPTTAGGHSLMYAFDENGTVLYGSEEEIKPIIAVEPWDGFAFDNLATANGWGMGETIIVFRCLEKIDQVQAPSFASIYAKDISGDRCDAAMKIETITLGGDALAVLNIKIGDFRFVEESAIIDQANDVKPVEQATGDSTKL